MCIPFDELNDDQQATVTAIFEDPPRSDILWFKVLAVFEALDGKIQEIDDRICVSLGDREGWRGTFKYSGYQGCVSRQMIRYLRDYLSGVGVEPK